MSQLTETGVVGKVGEQEEDYNPTPVYYFLSTIGVSAAIERAIGDVFSWQYCYRIYMYGRVEAPYLIEGESENLHFTSSHRPPSRLVQRQHPMATNFSALWSK